MAALASSNPVERPKELSAPVHADAGLVAQAQQGDRVAFATLVDRHRDRVYRILVRMVGDDQDAQDLAQEVFLKLYRSLGGFRGDADFTTWLHRLTVNLALDHLRARSRQPLQVPLTPLPDRVDAGPSAEDSVLHHERQRQLLAAVQDLPLAYRRTLLLRHQHHLTYEQIAAHIRAPVRTVETHLYRARALLRAALKAAEEGQRRELPGSAPAPGSLLGRRTEH